MATTKKAINLKTTAKKAETKKVENKKPVEAKKPVEVTKPVEIPKQPVLSKEGFKAKLFDDEIKGIDSLDKASIMGNELVKEINFTGYKLGKLLNHVKENLADQLKIEFNNDIREFAEVKFNIKSAQTYNLMRIAKNFRSTDGRSYKPEMLVIAKTEEGLKELVEKGFNNDSKIKDIKEYVTEHKKDNGSKFYSERKERGTVDRDNTNKEMAKAKNETEKLENEMENKKEQISELMKNFFNEYGKDISLDLIHEMEDYIKRN